MSESHAIALLADPNKIDLPKKDSTQDEMPYIPRSSDTGNNNKPTPGFASQSSSKSSGGGGGGQVIDLLEATQEKPIKPFFSFGDSKKSTSDSNSDKKSGSNGGNNVLDLSNIEVNDDKPKPPPELTPEEIRAKKERILYDMEKLRRKGVRFPRSFTMASDLNEMESEYNRIKKDLETEKGVRFQRQMLMTCVNGIEFLNNKFDPFDVKLDGWSESVHENISDYDDVFEELYEKYSGTGKMAPEIRLLFMLGGSALLFHMTKSMFSSASPQIADILNQNPQLANQMRQAAMQQMRNNMNGGGGGGGGGPMPGFGSMMGMGGGSGVQQNTPPPPRGVVIPPPDNADDVLRELQGESKSSTSSSRRSTSKTRGGRRSGGGGGGGSGIDSISLSLDH